MAGKPQKNEFTRYFREVQLGFSKFYAQILTRAGLSLPQFALLNTLAHYGPVPMGDAGKQLGISKPAVTYIVDRLEESGYVKRVPHSRDRRIILIKLMPGGERIVKKIQETVLGLLFKTMKNYSASQKTAITKFYRELSSGIEGKILQGLS